MLPAVAMALGAIRGAKSTAKVSMRTELSRAEVFGPAAAVALAARAADDLKAAGKIVGDLVFTPTDADHLTVTVAFAPPPPPAPPLPDSSAV